MGAWVCDAGGRCSTSLTPQWYGWVGWGARLRVGGRGRTVNVVVFAGCCVACVAHSCCIHTVLHGPYIHTPHIQTLHILLPPHTPPLAYSSHNLTYSSHVTHLTFTPLTGQGCNLAFEDALDLAHAIQDHGLTETALRTYEVRT